MGFFMTENFNRGSRPVQWRFGMGEGEQGYAFQRSEAQDERYAVGRPLRTADQSP